ncbi:hypothetical protein [Streptomyces canus]|uniref:hypothetical protein n=1 Tax=Streptomyces canus TaxID=58343 RepID=UPI002E37E4D6|nr:hypothetical protein [Streptomyces canus]
MKTLRALLVAIVLALLLPAAAPAMAATSANAVPAVAPASVTAAVPARLPTDIGWWDVACNAVLTPVLGAGGPATCVAGKIVAPEAKKAVSDALQSTVVKPMADGMGEFVTQMLKTGLTWWLTTPSIQVKDSGVTDSQTGKLPDGSTVTFSLQALMLGVGQIIAILLVMMQGIRSMIQRKGKPLADALQGMLINVLVCALGITVIDSLLVASDQLTEAIINVAFHGDAKLTERVVAMLLPQGFNPMGLLVMACIVFLVGGVQFILNFLRQAAIPIQALLLPIAGAGQIGGEKTKQWLPRIYTSIGVVIVYKPAAALIISAGFVEVANGNDFVDWFRGLVTLVLSVFALKHLMALFAPLGAAMAGATSGGFSGALAGAGGLMGMMSGGGKGDGGGSSTSAVQHAQAMDKAGAAGGAATGAHPALAAAQAAKAGVDAAGGAMGGQESGVPQQQGGPGKQSGGGRDGQGQGQGQDGGPSAGAGTSGGGSSAGAANTSGAGGNVTIAVRAAEAGSNRPGPGQNNGGQ